MPDRLIVVSTDCHAGLPIADYKPYVETRYHEMMDVAVPIQLDMMEKASKSFLIQEINEAWRAPIRQQLTGAWDYQERVRMLAGDGIAAEVMFPDGITENNTPPFGAGLGLSPRDAVPELQWAGAMAHNRWLAEFCANDPARHIGVASIPLLWDVQQAVEAVRWCVDSGLRAVMIPTLWGDQPAYHHTRYNPFWEVCEDLGVIVHFHSGPAPHPEYFGKDWPVEDSSEQLPGAMGVYVSEVMWWLYRPLTFLVGPCGPDEAAEQWMSITRCRGEFRMKLATKKPRVAADFHHLHQFAINRDSRQDQALFLERFTVAIIEFITMPVPLRDDILAIDLPCQATGQ